MLLSMAVRAEQADKPYLTVTAENDIYVPRGQDRHYTNGIRLGFGLDNDAEQRWYSWPGKLMATAASSQRYEFAFGQNIYNPEYYIASVALPTDRPYAAWLYTEIAVNSHTPGMQQSLVANVGIVGPAALGEPVQKFIHTITGDREPAGWGNQLRNEPTVLLRYRRSWFVPLLQSGQIQSDLVPKAGINLGNVFTDAGIGAALRIGNFLPEQDIPLRIQPGLSGGTSYYPIRNGQLDWLLFAELQGRAVARNLFLDGNTFRNSLSVKKRHLVGDAAAGVIFGFGQLKQPLFIAFSFVWRGREFELQQGSNSFGSAQVGIHY
jgi:lipid A 3-O-deacylase